MYRKSGIGLIAVSLLFAGCGGGDDSTSLPITDPNAPAAMATTDNADIVVSYVLAKTGNINLDPTGSLPRSAAPVSSENSGLVTKLDKIGNITKHYTELARDSRPATSVPQDARASGAVTVPCGVSGTISLVYNYSDPYQNTVGDSISMSFASCIESTYDPDLMVYVNEMLDGSLSMTITSVGADPYNDFTANVTYTNLTVVDLDSGDRDAISGNFTAALSGDGYTTDLHETLTGSSITLTESTGGVIQTEILSNFSMAITTSYTTNTVTRDYDLTVNSTEIGGIITINTVTPFVSDMTAGAFPTAGQMVISATSGAKVRVTAQPDGTNVFIEYDIDPIDGTYETSVTKTWSSL